MNYISQSNTFKSLIPLPFVSRTIATYLKRQQYLKQFLTHAKQRRQRFDEHISLPLPLPVVPLPCSRLLYGLVQHLPVGSIFLDIPRYPLGSVSLGSV